MVAWPIQQQCPRVVCSAYHSFDLLICAAAADWLVAKRCTRSFLPRNDDHVPLRPRLDDGQPPIEQVFGSKHRPWLGYLTPVDAHSAALDQSRGLSCARQPQRGSEWRELTPCGGEAAFEEEFAEVDLAHVALVPVHQLLGPFERVYSGVDVKLVQVRVEKSLGDVFGILDALNCERVSRVACDLDADSRPCTSSVTSAASSLCAIRAWGLA